MRGTSKFLVTVLVTSVLLLPASRTALADPVNGANSSTITFTCGDQQITFVTPSERSAVGQVIGTTSVGVVTEVRLVFSFSDPATGERVTESHTFILGAGHGSAKGLQDRLITCNRTGSFEDPERGTVNVSFTITQFLTPAR
jgi:hypothetical protein